ncbi:MAG: polysaccharide deacetylase family protein [Vicinamibacterales bacterium]
MTALAVLTYHAIADAASPLAVAPALFARTMARLAHEGWRTLDEGEVQAGLRAGTWPARSFVVHFDDGFASVKEHGWPVLRDLGFTATVFVVSGWAGTTNDWPSQPAGVPRWPLMTWDDLAGLKGEGATVAAHTVNHPRLPRLAVDQQVDEIGQSIEAVERRFGRGLRVFAYPYGEASADTRSAAGPLIDLAYTTELALVEPHSKPLAVPRVDACYLATPGMAASLTTLRMRRYLGVRRAGRLLRSVLTR